MAEDLKLQEAVKKTQDLLGKYIKKPPLTDKLLKKPPFRFIHDIISSVIKETGFLKNLFNDEELNSSNYTDKDTKLAYLNKLIDAVKLITGNELTVRSSKIISGQEPIKTNELLQAIGRALDKKVSSDEAIEYYKSNQQKKKDSSSKKSTKISTSADEKVKKPVKKISSNEKLSGDSKEKARDKDKDKRRDRDKDTKDKLKDKDNKDKVKDKDGSRDKVKRVGSKEKEKKDSKSSLRDSKTREIKKKDSDTPKTKTKKVVNDAAVPQVHDNNMQNETKNDETMKSLENTETKTSLESPKNCDSKNRTPPTVDNVENSQINIPPVDDKEINDKISGMNAKIQDDNKSNGDVGRMIDDLVEKPSEKKEKRIKSASLRPPSARPPSARPGAPRIRNKPDFIINNNQMTQMADINVIVENFDMKEEDADDMVVVETGNIDDTLLINCTDLLNNTQIGQEHGHLVAQILETQRDLVNEGNVEIIPNKVEIEWDAGLKKDRDLVVKEIDKLRGTIQMLTRATNPLGKLFDFLQEDVEIMQRELRDWRNQFIVIRDQLIVEKNNTNELMKPLEDSLREVEASIDGQTEKIHQTKCNILKNNQKIAKLLTGQ